MQQSQPMSTSELRLELLKIAEANSWPDSTINYIKTSGNPDIDEAAKDIVVNYDGGKVSPVTFDLLMSED